MARDPFKYFRIEARELTGGLSQGMLELERTGSGGEIVPRLLRLAHTLKGAARVVRLPEIADRAHSIEDLLTPFRDRTDLVAPEVIEALLTLIDGVNERVATLAGPEPAQPAAAAPTEGPGPPPEAFWARADAAEIDELFDSVSEAYTQLNSLGQLSQSAARARQLSDQIAEQLAAVARVAGHNKVAGMEGLLEISELLIALSGGIARGIDDSHQGLDREIRQVRDGVEQLRLVPAAALFPTFERGARDSAQALGKDIVFEGRGGDIRLDAQVVQIIQGALLQLIRNAVAHGIESQRDRTAAGKPPAGRVIVTVLRRGRHVVLRCEDDGRGIDLVALREAAIRHGRPAFDLKTLDSAGLVRILLQGGVSTSPTISEVAGRGIGMDIVREVVAQLNADFIVATDTGKGTRFELVVPQSVSSVEAILVEGGSVSANIPLYAVRQTMRLEPDAVHRTAFGDAIIYDGKSIPLVSLDHLLSKGPAPRRGDSLSAVVLAAAGGLAAVSVSRLRGSASVVFRSLPELAQPTALIAGASLDSDGSPLLMLDPDGLMAMALHTGEPQQYSVTVKPSLLVIDDSLTTRMLEQSILESAGYKVDLAVSGEEGLEMARSGKYALLLVDVEMPGMDGFTFVEHIRRDQKLRDTPAILVTSRNAAEDKRRGQEVGAQGYVVKSEFDQAELLAHIRHLVA